MGFSNQKGDTKSGASQLVGGQQHRRWKNSLKAEQKRSKFIEHTTKEQWVGQQRRDSRETVLRGHIYRAEWGSMVMYGIFLFLVILGTMSSCKWSVRDCGYFEVGCLMSLFAFSQWSLSPFVLFYLFSHLWSHIMLSLIYPCSFLSVLYFILRTM